MGIHMVKSSIPNQELFDTKLEISQLAETDMVSLHRMMQVFDNIPIAVTLSDKAGIILYANNFFTEITGYLSNEVIGKNHSLLSFKSTPDKVYAELWRDISQGEIWQGHLVNKRKDNARYLANIKIVPLKNKDEEIVFYMGMQTDVSDNHVRETKISNQDSIIHAVLNTMPSALALINNQQHVILDNLAYKTLATDFNAEPAQLVIKQLKIQLNIDENEVIHFTNISKNKKINIALEQGHHKRWFTCRLLNLEMNDVDIDAYFSPRNTDLFLLTITEYTREKRRDERQRITELQQMTAETEMMHAMQECMHAVLHQLQAPVNMIQSAVGMLNTGTTSASGLDAMNMALDASNDVLALLRNSHPERTPEARQSTNVNQVIHDLSQISTAKLLQHSIELRLSLAGTLASLPAQPSRLRVAFKKLLDNAIDAIVFNRCAEREILITTQVENAGLSITFEDSGIGIPKADRLKVFQPFFTTKPATIAGTRGIGLSIVQQVVNEHSGTVVIKSSKLGGSRVCVFLPRL
jgi:nitrogen fixation negative regulator NifL